MLAFTLWVGLMVAASPAARAEPARSPGDAAKVEANAMSQALLKGDFEGFASYTHPAMIKMAGGKKKLIEMLQRALADMKTEGLRIVSVSAGAPLAIVKAGDELHAILPQEQVLDVPAKRGELRAPGHLLGVSRDGGKTWKFLDAAGLTPETVRQYLPNYNPKLTLPPRVEPKFFAK